MAKGDRPKLEDFQDDDALPEVDDTTTAGVDDSEELAGGSVADESTHDDVDVDDDLDDDEDDDSSPAAPDADSEELTLRGLLTRRGMNVGEDLDDEAIVGTLIDRAQQAEQERQQWAQQQAQWQAYYQQQEQLRYQQAMQQQFIAQQQAMVAQQQQRQREYRGLLAFANQPPEFDPNWLQFIERDEHGNLTVKSGGNPDLLQKLAARRSWEDQVQRTLMEKPVEFVQEAIFQNPAVQQYIHAAVQQFAAPMVAQAQAQYRAELEYREQQNNAAAKALRETAGWIQNEKGELSEMGSLYMQAVQEASKHPQLQTVEAQHEWAMRYIAPYWKLAQQQAQKAATPNESGAAKGGKTRMLLLKKAATAGSGRAGSLPRTERKVPRQDTRLSLAQDLQRRLAAAGLAS